MIASGFRLDDQPAGGGVRRLVLRGELDAHAADGLGRELDAHLEDEDHAVHLVMDQLDFIDSAGLRTLVDVDRRLRSQGRRLVLEHPSSSVRHVLRIADLEAHFEIITG